MAIVTFRNKDHEVVSVATRSNGPTDFQLHNGDETDVDSGVHDLTYAWKSANTTISESEIRRYGTRVRGSAAHNRVIFGNQSEGRVP